MIILITLDENLLLNEQPKYILALHSTKVIQIDEVENPSNMVANALFLMVEKYGKQLEVINLWDFIFINLTDSLIKTCSPMQIENLARTLKYYYLVDNFGGMIMTAENGTANSSFYIECDCSGSQNLVSTRGALLTVDCLSPMTRYILLIFLLYCATARKQRML